MDKELIQTLVLAIFASSGFWAFLVAVFNKFVEKNSAKNKMIKGLGHDRIIYLGMSCIERGWITQDEYENLYDYLYKPYEQMGGNGSAKKVMDEVDKLPVKKSNYRVGENANEKICVRIYCRDHADDRAF